MGTPLKELRRLVLINLNDITDDLNATGDRYKTASVNSIINSAMQHYVKALNSLYQGYLHSEVSINLLANVKAYALGPSFRSPIYQVRRTIDTVNYFLDPMHTYNNNLSTIAIPNNSFVPTYELNGNQIVFSAAPTTNEANGVTVSFPMKMPSLVLDVDELDDQLYDAEDCIVLRASSRLLKSKDVSGAFKNTSGWQEELKEAEQNFYMQVGNRYVKPDAPHPIPPDYYYY